jgi:hypothetical protein
MVDSRVYHLAKMVRPWIDASTAQVAGSLELLQLHFNWLEPKANNVWVHVSVSKEYPDTLLAYKLDKMIFDNGPLQP